MNSFLTPNPKCVIWWKNLTSSKFDQNPLSILIPWDSLFIVQQDDFGLNLKLFKNKKELTNEWSLNKRKSFLSDNLKVQV